MSCLGLYPPTSDGGLSGPVGPGTDKSGKHSFSWEDMRCRFIYFFRHL